MEDVARNPRPDPVASSSSAIALKQIEAKRHLNVLFIDHVGKSKNYITMPLHSLGGEAAGNSTTGGQILSRRGHVTVPKHEKEANDGLKNKGLKYMACIMDTNEEERAKGRRVEACRAHYESRTTRFTILDLHGHKSNVANMISVASRAHICILVTSSLKDEFETGYEKGWLTSEHLQLAQNLGLSKLIVIVSNMGDPTVSWGETRYYDIGSKMISFLRSSGYNVEKDVQFLLLTGLFGAYMHKSMDENLCPNGLIGANMNKSMDENTYKKNGRMRWDGPCLFELLDAVEVPPRDPSGPFRMPIIDKFKDMGTVVMGVVESGTVAEGDKLLVMPNKTQVEVLAVYRDENKVGRAGPGENVRVRLSGIDEEDIFSGYVLSSVARPINAVTEFDAELKFMEGGEHEGYKEILHAHSVVVVGEILRGRVQQIYPKSKRPIRNMTLCLKRGEFVACRIRVSKLICVEKFSDCPGLGRIIFRRFEGAIVAVGKVTGLPTSSGYRL